MRCVIVTGMSGAGKSTALKMLEDMGYFCVDNLPVPLIPKMAELLSVPGTEINKAALGVDIRSGQNFYELKKILKELDRSGTRFEILYLESSLVILMGLPESMPHPDKRNRCSNVKIHQYQR